MIWLDFETRSKCDLKAHGVYIYARDDTTEVLCMSFARDDGDVMTTTNVSDMRRILTDIKGEQIRAHNAAFERLIIKYVLGLDIPLEQFYCTAAQARANCAPGSLEDVGRFYGASMKKDHKGAALIRKLSIPQKDGTFKESPYLLDQMIAYCEQDVRAMRTISNMMRQLTDEELFDYHVNERINDRGVMVDTVVCQAAEVYSRDEMRAIQERIFELTKGEVAAARGTKMRDWVLDNVGQEARDIIMRDGKATIDKRTRELLMDLGPDYIEPDVLEAIELIDSGWSSSVAKFNRLFNLADEDERVRGAFVFAGGSATGRASSYGAQLHNAPRECVKDPDAVMQAMEFGRDLVPKFGSRVNDVLRGMLRPSLRAGYDCELIAADWSAIEGRVNPWLSNRGDAKLWVFMSGRDVYKTNAAATFKTTYDDVTKEQRQVGKVQELACGFGGGLGAFAAMSKIYGLKLSEAKAKQMVNAWRAANHWAVIFWQDLESAYMSAMRNQGKIFTAGKISYLFDGQHLWYSLPSGRVLCYPFARFEENGDLTYAKASWKPAADAEEWPRGKLWPGLACENVTQATAHDLLRDALRRCERENLDVVLHVHDEIVLESAHPEEDKIKLHNIMTTPPSWAEGLPLEAEVKIMGRRYGK
ncbi:DNA polymerase [Caudoviricetes sp.]|nr:DNA polymerase [Caudoviricetes sp.]